MMHSLCPFEQPLHLRVAQVMMVGCFSKVVKIILPDELTCDADLVAIVH